MATTRIAHPGRATLRTAVEVGIPAFLGLGLILPLILDAVATGPLAGYLPPGLIG